MMIKSTKIFLSLSLIMMFAKSSLTQHNFGPLDNVVFDLNLGRQTIPQKIMQGNNRNEDLWTMVQTPSRRYFMTDVFFIDSLNGWGCHSGVGIGIVKTTNSGYSWDSVQFSPVGDALNSIHFVNRSTGWTCGWGSVIRKTTDGGNNWIVQDYLNDVRYHSVYFKDMDTGFVCGSNPNGRALIIKTTNSGSSWNVVLQDSGGSISEVYRQYWLDNKIAWFGGNDFLMKTTDGGITFTNMFPYLTGAHYGILGIYFLNNDTGWISGNNIQSNNIFKTTNGGLNWVFQNNPITQYGFPQINDIKFLSPDTGWAVAFLGSIIKTTDGGNVWDFDLDTNVLMNHLWVYKKSKIWCTADFGQIWYKIIDKTVSVTNQSSIVSDFVLYQNYPNPFNPETKITYKIPKTEWVILKVYDISGREISTLVDQKQVVGSHTISFLKGNLSSGIYFYKIQAGESKETKKMIVLK